MQQRIGVGVIIRNTDKILLGKRKGSHGTGTWGLPGGHLDAGEDIPTCAIRETMEETGLSISAIQHAGFTNSVFTSIDKQYITLFVEAGQYEGEPRIEEPDKCEEWRWFQVNELPVPLFPPLKDFVDQGYFA